MVDVSVNQGNQGKCTESGTGSAPANDRSDTRDLTLPNVHSDDESASRCLHCPHPPETPRDMGDQLLGLPGGFSSLKVDHVE